MVMRSVQPCAECGLFSQLVFEMALAKKRKEKRKTKQNNSATFLAHPLRFFLFRCSPKPSAKRKDREGGVHRSSHYTENGTWVQQLLVIRRLTPPPNEIASLLCCRIQFSTPYRPFRTRHLVAPFNLSAAAPAAQKVAQPFAIRLPTIHSHYSLGLSACACADVKGQ